MIASYTVNWIPDQHADPWVFRILEEVEIGFARLTLSSHMHIFPLSLNQRSVGPG